MKIRKAVFPVAGLGTRVLPATKAMPKEMLTIVDRPVVQHVVDEARAAGIEHFVFVTGRNKGVIEDHFDRMFELDTTLAARGKKAEQEIKKSDDELSQVEKKLADLNLKGLGEARDRKNQARKKVDDVVAAMAAGPDGKVGEKDFAKRLEWVKAFRTAKDAYDKEAAAFAAEVKKRADALGGEGGSR